jgi:hypothetical protein
MERINVHLDVFDLARHRTGSDEVSLIVLQEVAKDCRMKAAQNRSKTGIDMPATDKQVNFLKSQGVKIHPSLTKKQASVLIGDVIGADNALHESSDS